MARYSRSKRSITQSLSMGIRNSDITQGFLALCATAVVLLLVLTATTMSRRRKRRRQEGQSVDELRRKRMAALASKVDEYDNNNVIDSDTRAWNASSSGNNRAPSLELDSEGAAAAPTAVGRLSSNEGRKTKVVDPTNIRNKRDSRLADVPVSGADHHSGNCATTSSNSTTASPEPVKHGDPSPPATAHAGTAAPASTVQGGAAATGAAAAGGLEVATQAAMGDEDGTSSFSSLPLRPSPASSASGNSSGYSAEQQQARQECPPSRSCSRPLSLPPNLSTNTDEGKEEEVEEHQEPASPGTSLSQSVPSSSSVISSPILPTLARDLPGWMELRDLLDLLRSGPEATYDALVDLCGVAEGGGGGGSGGGLVSSGTPVGVCRRWWDAAWSAGEMDAAAVAVDVLRRHLDAIADDLFMTAEEQRARVLLAFLDTSPNPVLVRRVFQAAPAAAKATLRLAVAPVRATIHGSGMLQTAARLSSADGRSVAATAAAEATDATTRLLEASRPLEGFEAVERLLRSVAGSTALVVTLGLEAQESHAHGAELEANSCLGPLLGAMPCVLPINAHLQAADESTQATVYAHRGISGMRPQPKHVPVAHKLAKQLAELDVPGDSARSRTVRVRNALIAQYNSHFSQVARNRQGFVVLVECALVQAMTTKFVANESKADVCAWLSKAIFLHETLPKLCSQHEPELLGQPDSGSTCASTAFLMSFSALLLRLGARKFSSPTAKNLDSIDISYVEEGPVKWEIGSAPVIAASATTGSSPDASTDDESEHEGQQGKGERWGERGGDGESESEGGMALPPKLDGAVDDGRKCQETPRVIEGDSGDGVGEADSSPVAPMAGAAGSASMDGDEANIHQRPRVTRRRRQYRSSEVSEAMEGDEAVAFSFATELFFLTHRALQVILNPMSLRRNNMLHMIENSAVAKTGASVSTMDGKAAATSLTEAVALADASGAEGRSLAALKLAYKEAGSAMRSAWSAEGFGSEAITGLAAQFASFTAAWLERQMGCSGLDGSATARTGLFSSAQGARSTLSVGESHVSSSSSSSSSSAAAAAGALARVPPALIDTMCDSWMAAATQGRVEQFLSRKAAEDAARFCGEVMERVNLGLSPTTQSKLVDVLESLIQSGTQALDHAKRRGEQHNELKASEGEFAGDYRRGRSGGFQGSMYWGGQRGYAGAILDHEGLRRTLPRQLMKLYVSISSVEGLDAERHLSYFKFDVRLRVGRILLQLWAHPLGEPRKVILGLVAASRAAIVSEPLATDFFTSAFDVLTYFLNDAMSRLRDGVIEERANDGRALGARHAHWMKYSNEQIACRRALKDRTLSTLTLLVTLGREREVLNALREGALAVRSAALISVVLRSLYGEESSDYAVADPSAWGLDKAELGGMACQLLAGLAGPGVAETKAFVSALKSVDADFDGRLVAAAASSPGCGCLRGDVATRVSLVVELEDERRRSKDLLAAASATATSGCVGKSIGVEEAVEPFEGVPEEIDAEELERAYGEAMGDLVHTQVESLSPGHHFDRRREGSTLITPRKVASEILRKLPRTLPNPPHPDSAVFAIVEEDALNVSRFVISGPVGTPYEGGLFVFDVFLPQNYPADPPMVTMITTGQGTVKFNANLYADGKVCLSLLGKDTGAGVAGGDKWDPETSSLWQVFASIQTLVLVKDPYYNEGGGRSHMRGRGTAETEKASAEENARITLDTIRHATVANLRNPPRGCEELVKAHFRSLRNRMLGRCREACQRAPNERLRKATLRASADLRVELDLLET